MFYYFPYLIAEYAWKTIAKIATDVIEKMDMLVRMLIEKEV